MRRIFFAVLAVLALILAAVISSSPAASAMGKIRCDVSGQPEVAVGLYDPIVNHNGTGAAHEHQFFGNIAWHSLANPNTANYSDLVGKANNCRKVLGLSYSADSAGYWIPTLRYTSGLKVGQLIPAQQFTAYYRAFTGAQIGPASAIPADTRLIGTQYNWTCGQYSGARSAPVQAIPDCTGLPGTPGRTLTAHIDFPSCWDGVRPSHTVDEVGNTKDNAHYAYRVGKKCPVGFPIGVTEIRETVQFQYVGPGNDVALSSDVGGKIDGTSLHGDFWQTWVQPDFEQFVRDCVVRQVSTKACQP